MKTKRIFGELELAILQTFKDRTSLTIRDVVIALAQGDSYTTVMTVMNRLVDKGQLTRQLNGNQYEYSINHENAVPFGGFLYKLKNKVFGGKSASMITFLIDEDEGITDVELAQLEEIIKRKREAKKSHD